MRDSGIHTTGTIFNKLVQVLGYAHDLDIIVRSQRVVEEALISLEAHARRLGLIVNEAKTKYVATGQYVKPGARVAFGTFTFEMVNEFTYLGCQVNKDNDMSLEIKNRIAAAD